MANISVIMHRAVENDERKNDSRDRESPLFRADPRLLLPGCKNGFVPRGGYSWKMYEGCWDVAADASGPSRLRLTLSLQPREASSNAC